MSVINRLANPKAIPAGGSDNANFGVACIIPGGKQTKIYNLFSHITTTSGTGDTVEVVRSDAATTALCEVDTATTGVNQSSDTFPIEVLNTGTTPIALLYRLNGATSNYVDGHVIAVCDDPGAN